MKHRLWQSDSGLQRTVDGVAVRENEYHPQVCSRLSFQPGARILHGPTLAISRLAAGEVAAGWAKDGPDRIFIWEAGDRGREDVRYIGLFHPVTKRLQWGVRGSGHGASAGKIRGEAGVHWSVYIGALLLAYFDRGNPDVAEVWPLLFEEWKAQRLLGRTQATREALFLINDFLLQNRFFYIQDEDQIEPLPERFPAAIHDLSVELVGRKVPFSWLESSLVPGGKQPDQDKAGDAILFGETCHLPRH